MPTLQFLRFESNDYRAVQLIEARPRCGCAILRFSDCGTLIWPAVSYFIRGVAYLFGNVAMAIGDAEPLYVWDHASLYAIKSIFASQASSHLRSRYPSRKVLKLSSTPIERKTIFPSPPITYTVGNMLTL